MYINQLDTFTQVKSSTHNSSDKIISFKQAQILPYFIVKNISNKMASNIEFEDILEIVDMMWITLKYNKGVSDPRNSNILSQQGIRYCKRDDFDGFEHIYNEKTLLKETLLCPDNIKELLIQNNIHSRLLEEEKIETKFIVKRC